MRRFAVLFVLFVCCKLSGAAERPNILFIFTDDHAYQALSCYGSKINETPNLDRIAKEGVRFDNCFVTNSICGPCRAVIQTGKYSHLNGFYRNGNNFDGSQQTFPKLLQKAGYQTAVIGKWHLKSTPQVTTTTTFSEGKALITTRRWLRPTDRSSTPVTRRTSSRNRR